MWVRLRTNAHGPVITDSTETVKVTSDQPALRVAVFRLFARGSAGRAWASNSPTILAPSEEPRQVGQHQERFYSVKEAAADYFQGLVSARVVYALFARVY